MRYQAALRPENISRSFALAKARAAAPLLMRRRDGNRPRLMTVPRPSVKPAAPPGDFEALPAPSLGLQRQAPAAGRAPTESKNGSSWSGW